MLRMGCFHFGSRQISAAGHTGSYSAAIHSRSPVLNWLLFCCRCCAAAGAQPGLRTNSSTRRCGVFRSESQPRALSPPIKQGCLFFFFYFKRTNKQIKHLCVKCLSCDETRSGYASGSKSPAESRVRQDPPETDKRGQGNNRKKKQKYNTSPRVFVHVSAFQPAAGGF